MSRGSGTTPEYAMHCEPISVQNCYRSRLAELWLKAVNSLAGRSAGHEHVTESKGEPKFIIPISAEYKAPRMCVEALLKSAIRHMQRYLSTQPVAECLGSTFPK